MDDQPLPWRGIIADAAATPISAWMPLLSASREIRVRRRSFAGFPECIRRTVREDNRSAQRIDAPGENQAVVTAVLHPQEEKVWWVFLLEGIAAILVGLLLVAAPGATLLAMVVTLGIYWLLTGVLELVRVFTDRSVPRIWSLLSGIFGIAAGILVLNHPLFAKLVLPTTLVIYLGILGVIMGLSGIFGGLAGGGAGSLIVGVVNVVIGFLLLRSPVAFGLVAPFIFGIILLVEGLSLLVLAFRSRGRTA